eukprot:Blabericola_migrator_1__7856@NODE_4018_length_1379_cov_67_971799_g2477_i0_p3_GENE_NODE_4018_length_1379_cov_67_971799_g2477_i0NODE_4018_length_1379_cov_67_971799_g2477_i0_p3_ORF_typecomplete_len116_score22_64DsrD/PF08679_11/2_9e03DsrD/PF08679_11/0_052YfkD/PF14167_6/0_027THOC2_N/PF16134_5/0_033_NODE_4018_length_1379_cov_67_971799_g2477_i08591206
MTKALQLQTVQAQERVKREIQEKAQDIQALMDIYFSLQPNRALNVLIANPELLRTLNGESVSEQKVAECRGAIKAVQHGKSTGREKPRELIKIFTEMVNDGVISWNGCLSNLDFT